METQAENTTETQNKTDDDQAEPRSSTDIPGWYAQGGSTLPDHQA
jgi:hypothetical protein